MRIFRLLIPLPLLLARRRGGQSSWDFARQEFKLPLGLAVTSVLVPSC